MKIVNLETFRKLPENVLFCLYRGGANWGAIRLKGETFSDGGFAYTDFTTPDADDTGAQLEMEKEAIQTGKSFAMDFETPSVWRAGDIDADEMFVVYEPADLKKFSDLITTAFTTLALAVMEAQMKAKPKNLIQELGIRIGPTI